MDARAEHGGESTRSSKQTRHGLMEATRCAFLHSKGERRETLERNVGISLRCCVYFAAESEKAVLSGCVSSRSSFVEGTVLGS